MTTAKETLAILQKIRGKNLKELKAQQRGLEEDLRKYPGGRFGQKRATIRDLGAEVSRVGIQISVAEQVLRDIKGREVSEKRQAELFSTKEGATFSAIRQSISNVQTQQILAKKEKQRLKTIGFEPIRIRGRTQFRDIKTKEIFAKLPTTITKKFLPTRKIIVPKKRVIIPKRKLTEQEKQQIIREEGRVIIPKRKLTEQERKQIIREEQGFFVLEVPREKTVLEKVIEERTRLRTKIERGEKLTVEEQAKLGGLTATQSFIEAGKGIVFLSTLPFKAGKGVLKLIRNPENIKEVPKKTMDILKKTGKGFQEGGERFGRTLSVSPTEAIVVVGTEVLLFKGTGTALKLAGKLSSKATTQLIKTTPKFSKVEKGKIVVPSQVPGKNIVIEVVEKPVKKIQVPLREQIKLAGKETLVVSAQADKIVNLLKTKRVIRKPIPNEEKLKPSTKNLLDKFDRGKITKRQLIQLDKKIRKDTGRAGSLLERSFFASPKGKLRISRLGREPDDATLLDVLAGDVTFKTQKPQILIFEKAKIEKLPKALKDIEKKLKAGKSLTRDEANRLLQFQLKKSSKFKPVGTLSKEPEVTIAPGEIIRKVKTIAYTEIRGRRVPIIRAEIIKPKPSTAKLLKKAREGKITPRELKKLRKNLRKETGFKTSLLRRRGIRLKPRARLPKIIPRRKPLRRPIKRRRILRPPKRPPGRPGVPPPRRPPGRPTRDRVRGRPRLGPPPRGPPRGPPPRRPPIRGPPPRVPIPIKFKKRRRIKKKPKKPQAYEVLGRPLKRTKKGRIPKLIKVSKVPLSKKRAKDLRNYIVDSSLSRTAKIKKRIGKPTETKLKVPKGYSKRTSPKFRRHRIVKGKRIPLPKGKVIERGKFLLDTIQEQKQITLRRRIAQIRKPSKRKTIKRSKGIFG